jgi:hypothetical protein
VNSPAKSRIFERRAESKSLLVLFFRKERESSFSEEKEAKRLLSLRWCAHTGIGRRGALGGVRNVLAMFSRTG